MSVGKGAKGPETFIESVKNANKIFLCGTRGQVR